MRPLQAMGALACAGAVVRQLPSRQADACRRAAMVRRIYQDKLTRLQVGYGTVWHDPMGSTLALRAGFFTHTHVDSLLAKNVGTARNSESCGWGGLASKSP
jgi:hypothetical protein